VITEVKLEFTPAYDVEVLNDFPGTSGSRVLYIPPGSPKGGRDGLPVRIKPTGDAPWIGIFAFGTQSGVGYRQIVSCPNPDEICVIAAGAAYVVNVREPTICNEVSLRSVSDVRQVIDRRILLFADSVSLLAWGDNGLAWKSTRLAHDGVRIDEVRHEIVSGRGWDPSIPGEVHYRVNLADGLVIN